MLSYWEQKHFRDYDYLIIGAGLVGVSTALSLRELHENASIALLERGLFPTGASTKNAGFACYGSATELLADIEKMGAPETVYLVSQRWQGIQLLRKRVGDEYLKFERLGGYELITPDQLQVLDDLEDLNQLLAPVFGQRAFVDVTHRLKDFGFNRKKIAALVGLPLEAQLDAGAMMKRLLALARAEDIHYYTGAQVDSYQEQPDHVQVLVSGSPYPVHLHCRRLAICTNAFTRSLNSEMGVKPGRGLALITKPIPGLPLRGVYHYQEGFFYFRNVGDRILLGGGRNLDFLNETTTVFEVNAGILAHLKHMLSEIIIPEVPFEIDHYWSGIMGLGPQKKPRLGLWSPQVGFAVGLGGMGVALGSLLGDQLARLLYLNP